MGKRERRITTAWFRPQVPHLKKTFLYNSNLILLDITTIVVLYRYYIITLWVKMKKESKKGEKLFCHKKEGSYGQTDQIARMQRN